MNLITLTKLIYSRLVTNVTFGFMYELVNLNYFYKKSVNFLK